MKHATLYKRTKTGAIQQWTISVGFDATKRAADIPTIFKVTGQVGGKLTEHQEPVLSGKNIGRSNETTPQQQAESQALANWTKKHDEGYKSQTDLGIGHIVQCMDNADAHTKRMSDDNFYSVIDKALPQFNTDASGNVKPMLAQAVNWDKVTYPCLVQPKLDGVRCLMVSNGDDVTFLSRNGKEYTTLDHIQLDVVQYIIKYENSTPDKNVFILDGEIYSDEISFQEIIAAVKKQRPDSLKLKFRAYDMINEELQRPRLRSTLELVHNINSPLVQMVEHTTCDSKEEVKATHDHYVSNKGYEGAMIRLFEGKYDQGQRSSSLLKVKEFNDAEFAFLGFEKGQRDEDLIAVCANPQSITDTGEFRAKMVGTAAYKAKLYNDRDKFKGGSITIKYFGMTDGGLPRFPIGVGFRDYE